MCGCMLVKHLSWAFLKREFEIFNLYQELQLRHSCGLEI